MCLVCAEACERGHGHTVLECKIAELEGLEKTRGCHDDCVCGVWYMIEGSWIVVLVVGRRSWVMLLWVYFTLQMGTGSLYSAHVGGGQTRQLIIFQSHRERINFAEATMKSKTC
jgi:hypothetical protein